MISTHMSQIGKSHQGYGQGSGTDEQQYCQDSQIHSEQLIVKLPSRTVESQNFWSKYLKFLVFLGSKWSLYWASIRGPAQSPRQNYLRRRLLALWLLFLCEDNHASALRGWFSPTHLVHHIRRNLSTPNAPDRCSLAKARFPQLHTIMNDPVDSFWEPQGHFTSYQIARWRLKTLFNCQETSPMNLDQIPTLGGSSTQSGGSVDWTGAQHRPRLLSAPSLPPLAIRMNHSQLYVHLYVTVLAREPTTGTHTSNSDCRGTLDLEIVVELTLLAQLNIFGEHPRRSLRYIVREALFLQPTVALERPKDWRSDLVTEEQLKHVDKSILSKLVLISMKKSSHHLACW